MSGSEFVWKRPAARAQLLLICLVAGAVALTGLLAAGGRTGGRPGAPLALQPNHPVKVTYGKSAGHGHGSGGGSTCGAGSTSLGWASSNWSGYAETCSAPYTGVGGSWVVPQVSSPAGSYSATWIGIDGFNNSDLIQTGTEQDVSSGGTPAYAAWWTTSSNNFVEQPITGGCTPASSACGTVQAGDQITANISQASQGSSQWTITISDGSTWSFTKALTYTGPGASAEWIVEAPTVGGRVGTLADYASPLTFNPDSIAAGTISGSASPALTYSDGGELVTGHGRFQSVASIPSGPDVEQSGTPPDGFAISHGSVAPNAPSS